MSDVLGKFCKMLTKSGKPCKARPAEDGFCYFHAHPEQARILGQKGGRKNGYQVTEVNVPESLTPSGLGGVLDQTLRELLAGRLEPRVAAAVAQLVNTRRRVTETAELEIRIAEMEQKLAGPRRSTGADPTAARVEGSNITDSVQKEQDEGSGGDEGGNNGKA